MSGKLGKLRWGILALLAFPLFLAGQDMPRRFRGDPTSRPYFGWGMRGMMEATGLRMNRHEEEFPATQPTEGQWREISEYMQRQLPNAWDFYIHQPAGRQAKIKRQIFAKFQATQALRQSNQLELYGLRLRQQKLWDQAAGLIKQWRAASLDERPAIRAQIHVKVQQAMSTALKDQELRIKKLEDALTAAKERLAEDRQNLDVMVERRSNLLMGQNTHGPAEAEDAASPTTQRAAEQ